MHATTAHPKKIQATNQKHYHTHPSHKNPPHLKPHPRFATFWSAAAPAAAFSPPTNQAPSPKRNSSPSKAIPSKLKRKTNAPPKPPAPPTNPPNRPPSPHPHRRPIPNSPNLPPIPANRIPTPKPIQHGHRPPTPTSRHPTRRSPDLPHTSANRSPSPKSSRHRHRPPSHLPLRIHPANAFSRRPRRNRPAPSRPPHSSPGIGRIQSASRRHSPHHPPRGHHHRRTASANRPGRSRNLHARTHGSRCTHRRPRVRKI